MAKEFKRVIVETPIQKFKELDIKCTSTKCNEGLHCFSKKEAAKKKVEDGACIDCGKKIIDWQRFRESDIKDIKFLVSSLEKELIRYGYWNSPIDEIAISKAKQRGRNALKISAYKRVKSSIGKAKNFHEGWQTPYAGDQIIHYAQHATGTCCRICFEEWYGVEIGKALTEEQLQFCTELIMFYIDKRVPGLQEGKLSKAQLSK